jgi:hypothetical protein
LFGGGLAVWVNRFANAGDAAFEAVDNTMARVQHLKSLSFSEIFKD